MTADTLNVLVQWLGPWALPAVVSYFLLRDADNAGKVLGWIASGVARVYRRADKTAVALRVQGEINASRGALLRNAPADLVEGKLSITWTDAEAAEAVIRGGDVVVFMKPSTHQAENVTAALMAYLPKAVLPRARRYLDHETVRAIELTIARSMLTGDGSSPGALDVFFDRHLDPIRKADASLSKKLDQVDGIDLSGWLTRILLSEYRRLGNLLYPGDPDPRFLREAEDFGRWVHEVATRPKGTKGSLFFKGRYFNVAIVLVAAWTTVGAYGLSPYLRRIGLLYADRADVVFLAGRDKNIATVTELARRSRKDERTAEVSEYRYRLRPDFKARMLDRDFAICVALRPVRELPEASEDEEHDAQRAAADAELTAEVHQAPPSDTQSESGTAAIRHAVPAELLEQKTAAQASQESTRGATPKDTALRPSMLGRRTTPKLEVHSPGDHVRGIIKTIPAGQSFGFIADVCGHSWFFHRGELADPGEWGDLRQGEAVNFEVGRNARGPCARGVRRGKQA